MVNVKICGLKAPHTVESTSNLGARWIGFVLIKDSPRHVTVAEMVALLPYCGLSKPVALLDAHDDTTLIQVVDAGVSIIQLHSDIRPRRVQEIKEVFALEVWIAKGIKTAQDIQKLTDFECADRFVLDAPRPENSTQLGGHGTRFDWRLLSDTAVLPLNWMLAGGLTPENVGDAIAQTGCPAVDVSSGVEASRGVKDIDKIEAFIRAAKIQNNAVHKG